MNDLGTLTSQPLRLNAIVRDDDNNPTGEILSYMIYPLTFDEIGSLQPWVDSQFPDPLERTRESIDHAREAGKPFTVAQEQFLFKAAQELAMRSKKRIGMPEADQLLMSLEGVKQILIRSIIKGDPTFDDEKAERFFKYLTEADVIRIYSTTQINLVINDPKVETPDVKRTSTPNGGTMSRRQRRARKASTSGQSSTH